MSPINEPWARPITELGLEKQDVTLPHQREEWFFKYKDGTLFPYYKEDIKKVINVFKPSTFLPIMQELDIPFYEEQWLLYINRCIEKNGDFKTIFGKYLSWCKLKDIRMRTFKESDKFFTSGYAYDEFKYIVTGYYL